MNTKLVPKLFVSPMMCQLLNGKGITSEVPFWYHIYDDGRHFVVSDEFDYMGLYTQKIVDVPGVHTEYKRVPAYTLADMLALMPDYELSKEGNMHQVQCHGHDGYGVSGVHKSYTEAAAICVKKMIDDGKLSAEVINLKLKQL